jgi:hypothetical protein
MSKQTAVHWLMEQVADEKNQKTLSGKQWMDIIDRAIQMEKEQMIDAILDNRNITSQVTLKDAESYYKETYGDDATTPHMSKDYTFEDGI